ncbi:hypothetical protein [Streptomyces sp. NPDC057302]|uniref:hypothetical protein n=1 Tax=Streptomyces sp. NPDC057302 TaxID=3346094 RepID=UPI00362BDA16
MAVTKRSANGRQLLLLAALLFGIVTMHTLGHPTGHSTNHSASPAAAHSTSHGSGPERTVDRHEMSMGDAPASAGMPEGPSPDTGPGADTARARVAASAPTGMGGMDPMSVCLAVLAALTLVLLLKAGLLRPGGFAVPVRPLARLLDGLRPNPPPPRILLSRLSVLRI